VPGVQQSEHGRAWCPRSSRILSVPRRSRRADCLAVFAIGFTDASVASFDARRDWSNSFRAREFSRLFEIRSNAPVPARICW